MNKALLSALVAVSALFSTGGTPPQRTPPAFLNEGLDWADSVMSTLNSRQRIAQSESGHPLQGGRNGKDLARIKEHQDRRVAHLFGLECRVDLPSPGAIRGCTPCRQ